MFKPLLIVIFVLQSIAFNALAGTNMSQLNQAEMTKMQIMHQVAEESTSPMNHASCSTDASQTQSMIDYCSCDHEGSCQSLLCNSIHTSSPIDLKIPHLFSATSLTGRSIITLRTALSHAYYPPETPPPLV